MNGISTDVIALAAILGSAAVGGAVTLGISGDGSEDFSFECRATVVETAPRVVVSMGGDREAVVIAPDVSVSTKESCSNVVRVNTLHMERVREQVEHARERADHARERADRVRERAERTRERAGRVRLERLNDLEGELAGLNLDGLKIELEGLEGLMMLELDGLDELIEGELEGLDELLEAEIEGRLDVELSQLEAQLERLEKGNRR